MDAQTRDGILFVAAAVGLALLREPRGRRLLTVLKGALVGGVIGTAVFLAPQALLMLTHPGPLDDVQKWLVKVAALCGVFYGATVGAMLVGLVSAVAGIRRRWQGVLALRHTGTAETPLDDMDGDSL